MKRSQVPFVLLAASVFVAWGTFRAVAADQPKTPPTPAPPAVAPPTPVPPTFIPPRDERASDRKDAREERTEDRKDVRKERIEARKEALPADPNAPAPTVRDTVRDTAREAVRDARDVARDAIQKGTSEAREAIDRDNPRADNARDRRETRRELRDSDFGFTFNADKDNRLMVSKLRDRGIAARAGFHDNDVIVSVGGHPIRSHEDFLRWIYPEQGHERVAVVVLRDGREETLYVDPQWIDQDVFAPQPTASGGPAYLGVFFDPRFRSAVIAKVAEDSAAARAGMQPGDAILSVNGHPVMTSDHLRSIISRFQAGERAKVQVQHEGRVREVDVTMGPRPS